MKKYTLLLFLCTLLLSFSSYGQNHYVLSGRITDNNKNLITTGNVFLLAAKDSMIIKYAIISNGSFSFDSVNTGNYILKISCSGFLNDIGSVSLIDNTAVALTLERNINALREVTVTDIPIKMSMNLDVNESNRIKS